jgi:phage terminase small subunit
MRGRPRKSPDEHRANGTFRAKRHPEHRMNDELLPSTPAPSHFNPDMAAIWKEYLESAPAGVIFRNNQAIFENWCTATYINREATARIAALGFTDPEDPEALAGAIALRRETGAELLKLSAQLGFDPVSRTRVHPQISPERAAESILAEALSTPRDDMDIYAPLQ